MKFLPLIWAGLWRKPTRTIFTFLSIVVAFVLFGLLAGVDQGFAQLRDIARLDRLIVSPRFGAPMPISYREQIARLPGVTTVAAYSMMGGYFQDRKNAMGISSADENYFTAWPDLTVTKEQIETLKNTRTGVIATVALAQKFGWKVGDKIPLTTTTAQTNGSTVWTYDLVAICDDSDRPGIGRFMVANYDYFDQARAANKGTISRMTVRIADPNHAAEISAAIDELFANSPAPTRTNSEKANQEAALQSLGDINFLVDTVGGAVLFMLLFLTGNSMMQSVRERIPEFGVMKTLGFTDPGVLMIVLAESAVKFVLAAAVGLAIAKQLVGLTHGEPPLLLPWRAVAAGLVFAVVAATLSAIVPAWRVKRLSVVDALAGR